MHNVCVFIPSPVKVGTLLMEVPGTPIGASFFEFVLKPNGKDSGDPPNLNFITTNYRPGGLHLNIFQSLDGISYMVLR